MAVSIVQQTQTGEGAAASQVSTLPGASTAGNTLVLVVQLYSSDGASNEIDMASSNPVTDSAGTNTWVLAAPSEMKQAGTNWYQHTYHFYATNAASVTTVTANFSRSTFCFSSVYELTPSIYDQATSNVGVGTSCNAGTLTPTKNGSVNILSFQFDGSTSFTTLGSWVQDRNATAGGGTTYNAHQAQVTATSLAFTATGPSGGTQIWGGAGSVFVPPAPLNLTPTVQSNSATGSSATPSVTLPNTPASGNLIVAIVDVESNTTTPTITSGGSAWNSLTNEGPSTTLDQRVFWKIAGGSEPTTITCASANAPWCLTALEYPVGPSQSVQAPVQSLQSNASGTTTTAAATPTSGQVGLAIAAIMLKQGPSTWSAQQVNSSATGVVVEQNPSRANCSATIFDLAIASTTGSYTGAATWAGTAIAGIGTMVVFTVTNVTGVVDSLPFIASQAVKRAGYY